MRLKSRGLLVFAILGAIGCSDSDDSDAEKCDALLEVVVDCYDDYCNGAGATVPACQCWNNGQDINVNTCECIPLNLEAVCQIIDLDKIDIDTYDCSAATSAISDVCI